MSTKLEGEVKRIKASPDTRRKRPNHPALPSDKFSRKRTKARRKTQLQTAGGTPIIERPPEG